MLNKTIPFWVLIFLFTGVGLAQNNLDYYLETGIHNSPSLQHYQNLQSISALQSKLIRAQNSAFHVYMSADYLFAPYFNNKGDLISTDPNPDAIGYDAGITNGGLYSALFNVERNIFNGKVVNALQRQNAVNNRQYQFNFQLNKHELRKQITDQYFNAYQSLLEYRLSKEVMDNLSKQERITSGLVGKGYESTQNYLLLKVELQNQKINVKEALQNYKSDLVQLNSLCGIKDTTTAMIDSIKLKLNPPRDSSKFMKEFTLDSLATATEQAVFETKYQPQLNLFMNTGLNAVELDGIRRKFGFSTGLSLSIPIYDGGQKSITRQQSQIAEETISSYKQHSSTNLKVLRENSLAKIKSMEENLNALESQITDYRKLIRISVEQLETGGISMIDYLTMLRNFIDLRKTKINKQINYQKEINNFNYLNW